MLANFALIVAILYTVLGLLILPVSGRLSIGYAVFSGGYVIAVFGVLWLGENAKRRARLSQSHVALMQLMPCSTALMILGLLLVRLHETFA